MKFRRRFKMKFWSIINRVIIPFGYWVTVRVAECETNDNYWIPYDYKVERIPKEHR